MPARSRRPPGWDDDDVEFPPGERWSTWDAVTAGARGPTPYPAWLVTEAAARDRELGLVKTGKEADVVLLERGVPGAERSCLLAAKRYRSAEHRLFHSDAGYLEGRRMRQSRENRAMAGRTDFGRRLIADRWAVAEFEALVRLWRAGVPVPYPVQVSGTELVEEFIGGEDGEAAPRLVQLGGAPGLHALWEQLVDALVLMARLGLTHGDLSPYNLLVDQDRLVLIDLPQVVDVATNPQGLAYLRRDAANVARWFAGHGVRTAEPDRLADLLIGELH